MIEPATALAFSMYENKGVYALLLGSGVSRASHIPTGWEIILDLARKVGILEGVDEQADWAVWYKSRFQKEPSYSDLLDMIAKSPDERRSILHQYIEPSPEDIEAGRKIPTKAHRAIAKLVRDGFIRVIVTTNFDRLIENALQDEGVQPNVIRSDDDLKGSVPLIHSRCTIIKIHGDYLDTRIRNTEEELKRYSKPMNNLLDRILDDHGLLVCGWSADWDHALRAVIQRTPNRRYPMFWASRGDPSPLAGDLISHRKGNLLKISDSDSLFEGLQQKIETLGSMSRENPRSVDLLVASTKRFVSRPEYRIQLHDLLDEEVRRLKGLLEDPRLGVDGPWDETAFRVKVSLYESTMEPLIRIFSTLGRWGSGSEITQVTEILKYLGRHQVLGGLNFYIGLKTYPAVLLLYAYGIGALKADRYKELFGWLSTPISMENRGETEPASNCLFLWFWSGDQSDLWKRLEGYERHKTPLSDHLCDLFATLLADQTLHKKESELLFERFELMASLANGTHGNTKETLKEVLSAQNQYNYARIPLGRTGWNSQNQRVLFTELKKPEIERSLLDAGFANGDKELLEMLAQSLSRLAGRMHF